MSVLGKASENSELQKIFDLAVHHVYGLWNYRWYAVALAWVVCIAGWAFVFKLPNVYGASTVVYVDTASVLRPLLRGLSVETDVMNEVAIMTRAIVSRPNLEAVARQIDLDVKSRTPGDFERNLTSLETRIQIARDRQGIFNISFTDPSRETALKVVRSLLDTFVEDTLGSNTEDSSRAEQTLRAQIQDYERRLIAAEDRLTRFKQENVGVMPGQQGGYYQQLQAAMVELDEAQRQLRIEQQKLAALQRQLAGEEPVFGLMTPVMGSGGGGSTLDGRIAELEHRLSSLSIEYTDRHPEVVRTRSLLEELQERRQTEIASRPARESGPIASSPLDLNPVYQNMKIQLSNAQVEVARLQATAREKEINVNRLRGLVDVIPQVEAELIRLDRDYEVVRARHLEMLQRWENLQTSQRVGSTTDSVKFRVIEPPFAPSHPVGPPRALFLVGVSIVAVGFGVGAVVLLNLLRPVFLLGHDLRKLGLPILGSVMRITSPAAIRRARFNAFAFAGSVAMLLGSLAVASMFADPISELVRGLV